MRLLPFNFQNTNCPHCKSELVFKKSRLELSPGFQNAKSIECPRCEIKTTILEKEIAVENEHLLSKV